LNGTLSKRKSIGSSTLEWRDKSFTKYYPDIVYISANPYINSFAPLKGFSANEHFCKVYDLWHENWDSRKQTVLPEVTTKRAIEIIRSEPGKRVIIHYMQPHEPYLGDDFEKLVYHAPLGALIETIVEASRLRLKVYNAPVRTLIKRFVNKANGVQVKSSFREKLILTLEALSYKMGLRNRFSLRRLRVLKKLMTFLNMRPMSQGDAIIRKFGKQRLREAYEKNLNIVLKHAAELVDALTGKVVITSDHGEMLGEKGHYSHWPGSSNKFLLDIPWLVIDRGKKTSERIGKNMDGQQKTELTKPVSDRPDEADIQEIREKLKSLGYID